MLSPPTPHLFQSWGTSVLSTHSDIATTLLTRKENGLKALSSESMGLLNKGTATHHHIQTNSFSIIDLSLCLVDAIKYFEYETDSYLYGSHHFSL